MILCFGAIGCIGSRALPEEKALLPNATREKYWVIDLQATSQAGHHLQYCALITQSPTDNGGQSTSFYLSRWQSADSSYQFGMRTSLEGTASSSKKWPLVITIPGDSGQSAWRWHLNRKSMWMEGSLNSATSSPIRIRGQFKRNYPFPVQPVHENPDVTLFQTVSGLFRILGEDARLPEAMQDGPAQKRNGSHGKQYSPSVVHMAVFEEASSLLQADDSRAIYWLHFTKSGKEIYLLLRLDTDGQMETLAAYREIYDHQGRAVSKDAPQSELATKFSPSSVAATLSPTGFWTSPHSHKTYGLGIDLILGHDSLRLHPAALDQEIRAGRNAFWMGAIQQENAENHRTAGTMYVFSR